MSKLSATSHRPRRALRKAALLACCAAMSCLALFGCSGNAGGSEANQTSGPTYQQPASIQTAAFDSASSTVVASSALGGATDGSIDASHTTAGYVAAQATSPARLVLQIRCGESAYNYSLPNDGTPIVCPLNMGNGSYTFRIMQNTSGNNYVEACSLTTQVQLDSEFEPFLHPNMFCNYSDTSQCVQLARQLTASAQNQGDVMRAVYEWVVNNISYDYEKAETLADATGYVPSPDSVMQDGSGICFDYASLAAAMLRSLGIPCQIVTGYVSPDNVYHAWNMVYIDGTWVSVEFSIRADEWTRVDLTFAAAGAGDTVGDGTSYTDRYVY